MQPYLRMIEEDLYDISRRLKEIDDGYFLVFNFLKDRYEVHHMYRKNTFQFSVPYPELDCRTLKLAYETRVERMEELLRKMEQENAETERRSEEKQKKRIRRECEESLRKGEL